MTTDTFPKLATRTAEIAGTKVTLTGIAKGSGMIAPDMATMLAFVFTDAAIPAPVLRQLLARANDRSFNAVTVDGDTSTSDTLLLCATGQAQAQDGAAPRPTRICEGFRAALDDLLDRSGASGGARRRGRLEVRHDRRDRRRVVGAARRIGLAIANSPLVKTAIAGADANWGRIVMAVGKAGEKADRDKLAIAIGGVARRGQGPARARLRRGAGRGAYEGPGDRDRGRRRRRPRPRHRVDLRSDPRLYRHQCRLPELRPPTAPRAETDRLILRPLARADIDGMVPLLDDWDVVRHTARIPFPYTRAHAEAWLPEVEAGLEDGTEIVLAVTERASAAFLGLVGLEDRSRPRAKAYSASGSAGPIGGRALRARRSMPRSASLSTRSASSRSSHRICRRTRPRRASRTSSVSSRPGAAGSRFRRATATREVVLRAIGRDAWRRAPSACRSCWSRLSR